MGDYYGILGVQTNATGDELTKAYRRLSLKCHPDKGGAPEAWNRIQTAYTVLNDPNTRSLYDRYGPKLQPSAGNSLEIGTTGLILPLAVGLAFGFMLAFLNLFIGFTSSVCLAAFFIFLGATRLPNDVGGTPKRTIGIVALVGLVVGSLIGMFIIGFFNLLLSFFF